MTCAAGGWRSPPGGCLPLSSCYSILAGGRTCNDFKKVQYISSFQRDDMIIALIVFVWVLDAVSFHLYPNPSFVILSSAPVGSRCRQVQVVGGPPQRLLSRLVRSDCNDPMEWSWTHNSWLWRLLAPTSTIGPHHNRCEIEGDPKAWWNLIADQMITVSALPTSQSFTAQEEIIEANLNYATPAIPNDL